jgi:hypothetical protein
MPQSLYAQQGNRYIPRIGATPDFRMADNWLIRKEQLGSKWGRTLICAENALSDLFTFESLGLEEVEVPVALAFCAEFEKCKRVASSQSCMANCTDRLGNACCTFAYDGADRIFRGIAIYFSRQPDTMDGETAQFRIKTMKGSSQCPTKLLRERNATRPTHL